MSATGHTLLPAHAEISSAALSAALLRAATVPRDPRLGLKGSAARLAFETTARSGIAGARAPTTHRRTHGHAIAALVLEAAAF